jgi:hypothetical protein
MRRSIAMVADFTAKAGSSGLMMRGTETKSSGPTESDGTPTL